jgi:hypothetical protein
VWLSAAQAGRIPGDAGLRTIQAPHRHLLPANGTNVTIDNPTLNFAETGGDQGQCEGAHVTVTATAS